MESKEKLLKELNPKFNLLYELFMPTGRKIKSSLILFIVFFIVTIILIFNHEFLFASIPQFINGISVVTILDIVVYILLGISFIKMIIHIIFQKLQYNHISYKFYESYMVYEDDFLNQHKKNILYANIKEVEIRRSIWDRILGMGVIIIYTNAENSRNNGLVVYGLDNSREDYEFIDSLVNKYKKSQENVDVYMTKKIGNIEDNAKPKGENISENSTNDTEETFNQKTEDDIKKEEDFRESLKNIN